MIRFLLCSVPLIVLVLVLVELLGPMWDGMAIGGAMGISYALGESA